MSARTKISDTSYSHPFVSGSLEQRGAILNGVVATPHGWVRVISGRDWVFDAGLGSPEVTRFQFLWRGRHYDRTYNRFFTWRGAARVAARFARQIAGGHSQ
ncbi:MAG: hypothetical protein ABR543_09605 [Gemmatimonadaceae bacterium]